MTDVPPSRPAAGENLRVLVARDEERVRDAPSLLLGFSIPLLDVLLDTLQRRDERLMDLHALGLLQNDVVSRVCIIRVFRVSRVLGFFS